MRRVKWVGRKKRRGRGENDSIRAKSRLRLISVPKGVKLYLEGVGKGRVNK